jgi:hypothetical protein
MSKFEIGGQQVNGIVHLSNEFGTNANKMVYEAERIVSYLSHLELEHKYVKTSEDRNETIGQLQDITEVDDAVIIYGGEGTVNVAAEAYLKNNFLSGIIIPHLIRPGGNKNDLFHSLNKVSTRDSISNLFSMNIRSIYPLEFCIDPKDDKGVINQFAISYGGFGAIANASRLLNERRSSSLYKVLRANKISRFILESECTLEGLTTSKPFSLIDHNNDGREVNLVELSYINGSRMAGGIINTSIEADDNLAVRIEEARMLDLIVELGSQAISPNNITSLVDEINDDFTLVSGTMFHLDAEHRQLHSNTRVRIKRSKKPFYVLSNK